MATILSFPATPPESDALPKSDKQRRRYTRIQVPLQVVSTTLPSGEGLPVLVRADTWLPASLALRWVVYTRRFETAEGTLRTDLSGLRFVYAWGDQRFAEGLDARLSHGPLSHGELVDLTEYLRSPGEEHEAEYTPVIGRRALAAQLFLRWALSPANRNEAGAEPANAAIAAKQIDGVLGPLAAIAGRGGERFVPEASVLDRIEEMIRPRMNDAGLFRIPLVWSSDNPFQRRTRLRNWLMWCLARDHGLRIGEILTLKLDDILTLDGEHLVNVVRRPDDVTDCRRQRPQVKTLARPIPMSAHAHFAFTAYLRQTGPGARRRGSVYLITASTARPLSVGAAEAVMKRIQDVTKEQITWHALRHAWATEIARNTLNETMAGKRQVAADEVAQMALLSEELRLLGGWSVRSREPLRYARAALREYANAHLRAMQSARAQRAAANASVRRHGAAGKSAKPQT